jgi:hypothetical protein
MNQLRISLMLISAAALFACSSAQQDWNKASTANTVGAYQEYLGKHPSSEHSTEASDRIHSLHDDSAWQQAKQANSADAYQDYLQKQPNGAHLKEAQEALATQQRVADWKAAESAGTVAALQDFVKKHPDGTEADQARAKLAQLSGYKVQLASVATEKQAQRQRDHLRAKYGSILHDVVVVPTSSGKGYGIESAPMSQSQANSACAELKKAHQGCEVIKSDVGTS